MTLEASYNKKLQLREKRNEVSQLKNMLEETKKDLTAVQAIQSSEQKAVSAQESQITQ